MKHSNIMKWYIIKQYSIILVSIRIITELVHEQILIGVLDITNIFIILIKPWGSERLLS